MAGPRLQHTLAGAIWQGRRFDSRRILLLGRLPALRAPRSFHAAAAPGPSSPSSEAPGLLPLTVVSGPFHQAVCSPPPLTPPAFAAAAAFPACPSFCPTSGDPAGLGPGRDCLGCPLRGGRVMSPPSAGTPQGQARLCPGPRLAPEEWDGQGELGGWISGALHPQGGAICPFTSPWG